jgi:hypothetical protein
MVVFLPEAEEAEDRTAPQLHREAPKCRTGTREIVGAVGSAVRLPRSTRQVDRAENTSLRRCYCRGQDCAVRVWAHDESLARSRCARHHNSQPSGFGKSDRYVSRPDLGSCASTSGTDNYEVPLASLPVRFCSRLRRPCRISPAWLVLEAGEDRPRSCEGKRISPHSSFGRTIHSKTWSYSGFYFVFYL